MNAFVVFALTIGGYAVVSADHGSWSYKGETGPDNWSMLNLGNANQCGRNAQSPIDIETSKARHDKSLSELNFQGYGELTRNTSVVNNGHSIQLNSAEWKQTVTGGPLSRTFKLLQMHFHWGTDSYRGSEHTVNGKRYPIELHLVHVEQPEQNKPNTGSLAVVGIFFELTTGTSNVGIQKVVQVIKDLKANEAVQLTGSFFPGMFLPINKNFYTYKGSLTTPPCSEIVNWLVLPEPMKINETDLAIFRSVLFEDSSTMGDNFRPVMPLNGREVKASFSSACSQHMSVSLPLMIMSALFCKQH
jgi:carbonic anhydrase